MTKFLARFDRVVAWFDLAAHRRRLYRTATVVTPVLVTAGVLTNGRAAAVLSVLAILAGAAVPHLAANRTKVK